AGFLAEAVLEPFEIIAAGIIVLVENADLALRQIVENVPGKDTPPGLVGRWPAHGPRESLVVAEFGSAGGDKELRPLLAVEIFLDRVAGRRAQILEDQQYLVVFHELARLLHRLGRAEGVVIGNEIDLAAVDTALVVDHPEKGGLGPADQRVGRQRPTI